MNVFEIKDSCRANLLKYTIEAFNYIPKIENPKILDLGCGTGVSTLEFAKLTNGKITAIDSDKKCLNWLNKKIEKLDFNDKITTINDSILEIKLPNNNYDIIIAEGILNIVGFKRGLLKFSQLLKTNGYFLIHDEFKDNKQKLTLIKKYNFKLIKSIILNEKVWWREYYRCLEEKIEKLDNKIKKDKNFNILFQEAKLEIDYYKNNPSKCRSIIYVLQKNNNIRINLC
jgi:ubiquinone/menaquinone biosynthesis C-methylase UbiE